MRKVLIAAASLIALAALYWWSYAAVWLTIPRYRWAFDQWIVRSFGDALDRRTESLAASGAVNCGRARLSGCPQPADVTECALDASRHARSFRARYDVLHTGNGTEEAYALVSTPDGHAFALFFRGWPSQTYLGGRYLQKVDSKACPLPTVIRVEYNMATCFPPQTGGD